MSVEPCILVNGEAMAYPKTLTIVQLLEQMGLAHKRVAVEVNGDIVPRSRHAMHELAANDAVEIVQAIGGG